jgi:hypothetical protein
MIKSRLALYGSTRGSVCADLGSIPQQKKKADATGIDLWYDQPQ